MDDGRDGLFGGEIEFRSALEVAMHKHFSAPIVVVVVEGLSIDPLIILFVVTVLIRTCSGGPGTINTALQARRKQIPVVVSDFHV